MNQNALPLDLLLADDLPPGFVRALLDRTHEKYKTSYDAVHKNQALGEDEANYLLGHQRRGEFETMLRNTAVEHRLPVQMERSKDEEDREHGCKYVRVFAGRFHFTACHVISPHGFPRHSRGREQYSKINEHAAQGDLFPLPSHPEEANLYGVIVHTEYAGQKDKLRSIAIGFPNPDFSAWIQDPYELDRIENIQKLRYQKFEDLRAPIQKATPIWKKTGINENKGDEE